MRLGDVFEYFDKKDDGSISFEEVRERVDGDVVP